MIYIKEAYPPAVGGVEDRYTPGVRIYTAGDNGKRLHMERVHREDTHGNGRRWGTF